MHNDLKPDNIVIGFKDPENVYLIDYGLGCKFIENGQHIKKVFLQKFSGNIIFASLNSCRGNSKSRRDDIQSLVYLMIYLLNKCQLPWSNFHLLFKGKNDKFKDYLRERNDVKYLR